MQIVTEVSLAGTSSRSRPFWWAGWSSGAGGRPWRRSSAASGTCAGTAPSSPRPAAPSSRCQRSRRRSGRHGGERARRPCRIFLSRDLCRCCSVGRGAFRPRGASPPWCTYKADISGRHIRHQRQTYTYIYRGALRPRGASPPWCTTTQSTAKP